ncbi:MAG: RecX family transcriptional regulator, partial [Clostridia bacterium]|nr:RecX family transcriptional regulator [Clostridia bacterium]
MPKITDMQIQKKNKTRANVYLDGEFAFGLEMLTVMKLGLKIGQEISERQLAEAVFDSEKSVAFEKAVNYLSRSMKTVKQMREYLTEKGYAPDVVNNVVERLCELKYLNDETYAKLYVEQNLSV